MSPEKIEKEIKFIFTANKINSTDIKNNYYIFSIQEKPITPKRK